MSRAASAVIAACLSVLVYGIGTIFALIFDSNSSDTVIAGFIGAYTVSMYHFMRRGCFDG